MHHFASARRIAAIVATTSFVTSGVIATSALPASAACGQDGTWIGTWAGASGAQTLAGTMEIDHVTFTSTSMTGTVSFVTGTVVVLSNQAVHAHVGSDCHDLTSGTVGNPTRPVITFSATLTPDGAGINGLFDQRGTTFGGDFHTGRITDSTSDPNASTLTFPTGATGATPAGPVWVNVVSPTSGQLTIGNAQVPGATMSGWAVLGPPGSGYVTSIVAPPATPNNPLLLTFEIDKSLLPDPSNPGASILRVLHNGAAVSACVQPGAPDPCVTNPTGRPLVNGNPRFVVRSSGASLWAIGRATKPSAPRFPLAVPGNGRATVRWTKPARPGGPAITGYLVTPYLGAVALTTHTVAASANKVVIGGLANGSAYTFKVRARTLAGAGPPATTSKAIVVGAPTAPKSQSATAGKQSATVRWLVPASDNGAPITGYNVSVIKDGVLVSTILFDWGPKATTQTLTGLTTGATYTFYIGATNARGYGPRSGATKPVTPT